MKALIMSDQIKYETEKSKLITLPQTNAKVWIANKLIFSKNRESKVVLLPKGFEFSCVIDGHSKTSLKLSAGEIYDYLTCKKTTLKEKPAYTKPIKEYGKINIPKRRKPIKIEADDSLIR